MRTYRSLFVPFFFCTTGFSAPPEILSGRLTQIQHGGKPHIEIVIKAKSDVPPANLGGWISGPGNFHDLGTVGVSTDGSLIVSPEGPGLWQLVALFPLPTFAPSGKYEFRLDTSKLADMSKGPLSEWSNPKVFTVEVTGQPTTTRPQVVKLESRFTREKEEGVIIVEAVVHSESPIRETQVTYRFPDGWKNPILHVQSYFYERYSHRIPPREIAPGQWLLTHKHKLDAWYPNGTFAIPCIFVSNEGGLHTQYFPPQEPTVSVTGQSVATKPRLEQASAKVVKIEAGRVLRFDLLVASNARLEHIEYDIVDPSGIKVGRDVLTEYNGSVNSPITASRTVFLPYGCDRERAGNFCLYELAKEEEQGLWRIKYDTPISEFAPAGEYGIQGFVVENLGTLASDPNPQRDITFKLDKAGRKTLAPTLESSTILDPKVAGKESSFKVAFVFNCEAPPKKLTYDVLSPFAGKLQEKQVTNPAQFLKRADGKWRVESSVNMLGLPPGEYGIANTQIEDEAGQKSSPEEKTLWLELK